MAVTMKTSDSRVLENGVEAHIARPAGGTWFIRSYDRSWFEGTHFGPGNVPLGPRMLKTGIVHAQQVGWDNERFDTEDEAFAFIEQQIAAGSAPALPDGLTAC